MKKVCWRIIATVILTSVTLYCSNNKTGTTAAVFTKIDVSPRVVSLGGAYTSLSDVNSVLTNPAGISKLENKELTFSWTQWLVETNLGYFAIGIPVSRIGNFAVGLKMFNAGEMEETDNSGNFTGRKFSASDMLVTIGYARNVTEKISVGTGIKYITQTIDKDSANTLSVDLGAQAGLTEKLNLGVAVQHLFGEIKFVSESYKLPLNFKFGASYLPLNNLLTSLDITVPSDNNILVGLGVEYQVKFNEFVLPLRAGYKTGLDIEGSGISAGVGLGYKEFVRLDITWSPYGTDFGSALNAGLSFKF